MICEKHSAAKFQIRNNSMKSCEVVLEIERSEARAMGILTPADEVKRNQVNGVLKITLRRLEQDSPKTESGLEDAAVSSSSSDAVSPGNKNLALFRAIRHWIRRLSTEH